MLSVLLLSADGKEDVCVISDVNSCRMGEGENIV